MPPTGPYSQQDTRASVLNSQIVDLGVYDVAAMMVWDLPE